ncbi:hypothetical protein FA15DRAFT_734848 [Coprinopsis marcescibilis]|uniref:Uncharacterized protein n=1 Tax=Coprinopsis marcescibilis TaxID=230819 RepID=A0A5C3KBL5_COPMA|nr:hypothetical protein FA15DRAFT_734848 [Coprinopsis marcescibilis]
MECHQRSDKCKKLFGGELEDIFPFTILSNYVARIYTLYEALKYSDTAPVSQDPPPSLLRQCEGIKLKWDLGNPHHTYPFGMHSPSNLKPLDYDVSVVNSQESILRHFNTNKAIERLRKHRTTLDALLDLLGTKDVPALHRIFRNAHKFGCGSKKLLEKVTSAIDGKYHAKNFVDWELDLAILIYNNGALHVLHNSAFAFPCRQTLAERRSEYKLRISIGDLQMSDLLYNIEVLFKNVPESQVGITLCLDKVASDRRLCWIPGIDQIVGVCEHESHLETTRMGNDLSVVCTTTDAIRDGTVHLGHEILVAVFARNAEEDYGAKPVLILPTCKQGSLKDAALVLEKLKQAWRLSPFGEKMHGPIWSLSSDGDPKRRPALYLHSMVREIKPDTDPKIFDVVGSLQGLNLWVGPSLETQDLDWNHCIKRLCKLLGSQDSLLVNNCAINKKQISMWLKQVIGIDWSEGSLFHLLNPISPKPSTPIKLLSLTAEVRTLDQANMTPSDLGSQNSVPLLGEMFEALLEPFIQISCLGKFAHILCALFVQHQSAFMPAHLYSDLQCMVRTAVFPVA